MTIAAQARKLVKPLLAQHQDLALVGRWIILKPVRHVVRAILIGRTSDANWFRPTTAVSYLCGQLVTVPLNWGMRLTTPDLKLWFWDSPRVPEAFVKVVEEQALPVLRPIETLDDFVAFANSERFPNTSFDSYEIVKLLVDVARGDFESAHAVCRLLVKGPHRWWDSPFYDFATNKFCPLVAANDRAALARQLHEWEAQSVKTLKLEPFWEPTPFPLELQTSAV